MTDALDFSQMITSDFYREEEIMSQPLPSWYKGEMAQPKNSGINPDWDEFPF